MERALKNSLSVFLSSQLVLLFSGCLLVFFFAESGQARESTAEAPASSSREVLLSAEESAWLVEHGPRVRVSLVNLPPLQFEQDGKFTGYQVEILEAVLQKAGLQAIYSLDPLTKVMDEFKENRTEIALDFIPTKERGRVLLFSEKQFDIYFGIFARKERTDLNSVAALKNAVIASHPGYGLEPKLKRLLPDAEIVYAEGPQGMFRLVASGAADVAVHGLASGEFMLQKNLINNVVSHGEFLAEGESRLSAAEFVVRKDLPHLMSIIDKTYASIDEAKKQSIWDKWFGLSSSKLQNPSVILTDEERSWLAKNRTVQVRVINVPPYIILKKDADPKGISIDYLKLISKRTGIKFNYDFSRQTFPEALEGIEKHQGPDLITSTVRTPEREKSILFSKDYFRSPYVIFTHEDDKTFVSDIDDLSGKKIALPQGTVVHEKIMAEYPNLTLELFDSDVQAIEAVATRKAEAYIGNLTLASSLILEKGLTNLKIAGPAPFGDHIFAMAIRNDWPELASIIDKVLASISPEEKTQIRSKYFTIDYEHTAAPVIIKWLIIIGSAASGIVVLFVVWNKVLRRKVQQHTADLKDEIAERKWASDELGKSEAQYRGLVDNAIVGVFKSQRDGHILFVNDALAKMFDFENAEKMVAEGSLPRWSDPEQRQSWLAELKTHGSAGNFETEAITSSGKTINLNVSARLIGDHIAGMVMDITARKKDEFKLQEYQERLKALASQLTLAEERERRHIAADLHDNVGQTLAISRLQLAAAIKSANNPELKVQLEELSQTLLNTAQDTRNLIFELSSPAINEIGLGAAIGEWLEEKLKKNHPMAFELADEMEGCFLDEDLSAILFRNVRELITNTIKHAKASKLSIRIGSSDGMIRISVQDNGTGFNPQHVLGNFAPDGGFGIFSIQERMVDLGGALEIKTALHQGCTMILTAPCTRTTGGLT